MPKLIINKDKIKDLENLKEIIAERDNFKEIVESLKSMGIVQVDETKEFKDPELEQENNKDDQNAYYNDKENFNDENKENIESDNKDDE